MDCPRLGKLIGGCKFEPRYSEEPLSADTNLSGRATAEELRLFLVREVYECDVCIRCGKTTEKEPNHE